MFGTKCAWVCARLGRAESVSPLRAMLDPYPSQLVVGAFVGWVMGPVALYLALLAATVEDWEEAEAHFAAAAASQERMAAPGWLARTRLEWARMLLVRSGPGDGERAAELLARALLTARQLGLSQLERESVELLGVS